MSREAYQVPTGGDFGAPKFTSAPQPAQLSYICGDCGLKSSQHQTVPFLRCKECGCRILYKERTKRYAAFPPVSPSLSLSPGVWDLLGANFCLLQDGTVRGAIEWTRYEGGLFGLV